MTHKCNGDCFSNYNKDDDDFVIQRLQDIITICEFLIKHEKNSKSKRSLKAMLDEIAENEEKEDNNGNFEYYINRYKPVDPFIIKPYYHSYPWWDRMKF